MNLFLLTGLLAAPLLLAACQTPGTDLPADFTHPTSGSATSRPTSYSISSSADEDDLVAAALKHHPSLQATRSRIAALEQSAIQKRYLPDPSASVTAGQMAQTAAGESQFGLGVQQKIPYPGKRGEQSLATLRMADAMRAQLQADELTLAERIRIAYWDYFLSRKTAAVVGENKAILKSLRESVDARIAVNKASQQDLLRLGNEITRLDQRLAIAKG
ncbi:MAG: TolC family protein, partial [Verrucomicrobia bacterium]|nr:TolC family protein [Verrucomicrobiota bacterium]